MQDTGIAGFFVEKESQNRQIENWQPKVNGCKVFVLLHKKVGAVADVKISHDKGQSGQGEHQVCEGVAW